MQDPLSSAEPEDAGAAAADPGTAFAELQELFPGRILEIVKDPAVAEQPSAFEDDDQTAGLDDDEGYDDPDQARLSFGLEN